MGASIGRRPCAFCTEHGNNRLIDRAAERSYALCDAHLAQVEADMPRMLACLAMTEHSAWTQPPSS